jgi:sugar (pentulose or hexulose) kinase
MERIAVTKPSTLIGLDLGTSAIKGVLVGRDGAVLAEASVETALLKPCEGWVEADAEELYRRACGVIRRLTDAAPAPVAALAMSAASGNTLLADAAGAPLTPVINWMDQRAVQDPPPALEGLDPAEVHAVTGWPWLSMFPLAHLAWLAHHRPEAYQAAGRYAMDTDWLVHRLTGLWRMDRSTATTSYLVDQASGAFHEPYLRRLGIGDDRLSSLVDPGMPLGPVTPEAADATGLPAGALVVAGSFDHPSAARGVGTLEPGDLLLSCGTSWVGLTPCARRGPLLEAGLLCDPFVSASGGPWAGMFSVTGIGRQIDWYIDHLIAPGRTDRLALFNEAAASAPSGAGGLKIDLRLPPEPIDADVACISRAVMEGAASLLSEKLLALRPYGMEFRRAVMVGGPSASPIWPGILAEAAQISITVGGRSAGARGAAVLAGIGAGWYSDEAEARGVWSAAG